jgi:muramoyltetrapeptide carboxypeptidase
LNVQVPGLRPGDCIGVAAPGYPGDPEEIRIGAGILESLGYRVRLGAGLTRRRGYLAGADEERADALNRLIADPDVRGILFARGGFGTGRILHRLDLSGLRRDPRLLVGYSDLTALFLALQREGDYPLGYGPHLSDLARGRYQVRSFRRFLRRGPGGERLRLRGCRVLRPGRARGVLQGGCLSLLQTLLGTPWQPDLRGRLLFWEDWGEEPYRIDRMLGHLAAAGILGSIAGMIVGRPVGIRPRRGQPSLSLDEVIGDHAGRLGIPVVLGLAAGHTARKLTLSLGVPAALDTGEMTLTLELPG